MKKGRIEKVKTKNEQRSSCPRLIHPEIDGANHDKYLKAKEIIQKFPVTNDMFPQVNIHPVWIVCK